MAVVIAYCPLCRKVARVEVTVRIIGKERVTKSRCINCGRTIQSDNEKAGEPCES